LIILHAFKRNLNAGMGDAFCQENNAFHAKPEIPLPPMLI